MEQYLIDTNVIVDYLGGKLPHKNLDIVNKIIDKVPFTSVICKIEALSFNFLQDELIIAESFLDYLILIELNEGIVDETIQIRRQFKIKTPDAIIAATSKVNNLTIVTRNTKDFIKIPQIKLYNPWT